VNGGAEAYSIPAALQALVRTFGYGLAKSLAAATEAPLQAAVGVLNSVLTAHSDALSAVQTQLQVGMFTSQTLRCTLETKEAVFVSMGVLRGQFMRFC
jgi:hypothetical protein